MKQVVAQGGHFLLQIKGNQPQSYGEVVKYFGEMSEDHEKMKENADHRPRHPEMMEGYEEVYCVEKNRDRYERRWYKVCSTPSLLTKTQEEWPFIKTVGQVEQVRILIVRDGEGRDITPALETFLKEGSRRQPNSTKGDGKSSDIQVTGIISDRELSAEEMGKLKRAHWAVENRLHHVLDDTFREDRSPAKRSKISLALNRKFAYNILRLAMLSGDSGKIMPEAMDGFCDDHALIEKYVFCGINSLY